MPTKDETTVAANVTDTQVVAEADNKKTIRKEMKKAKAHMALVSDEFHNVLS
jgi:CBS domain containing-hemolysin-like protein